MARVYYVSCIDGNRKSFVAGPFAKRELAVAAVRAVQDKAHEIDPRSHFYAWGTAGYTYTEGVDAPKSVFEKHGISWD